jgi:tripartite-type tricarboxylate transporter receptor subunit TctC
MIIKHWGDHIPGNPVLVPKNMPGAGNLRATGVLYNQAPTDGTTIAAIIPAFVLQQLVGGSDVAYDAARFQWLGSSNSSNPIIYVWHAAGIRTLEDAMTREVLMGGTGAGSNSVLYPTLLNNLIGTKFKVVMGYDSSGEVNLAMERGEVQGRASETFSTLMANQPNWLVDGKIDILVQIGREKEHGFNSIPLVSDYARDAASREVIDVFSDVIALGRPYLAPPGTPADRVAALRTAFDATMQDPVFRAEAEKARLDLEPVSGVALQAVVEKMVGTSDAVRARVRAAVETKN